MGFFDTVGRVAAGVGTLGLSEVLYFGPKDAGDAAQAAAENVRSETGVAVNMAQPTAEMLNQRALALQNQQQFLSFEKSQLDSLGALLAQISPVLAQGFAAQSAAMSGQNSGPISKQIEIERQQNLNRQVAGMGTGASSSSAGMAADALFGQQAGLARQQDIQNLGNINAQNASIYGALAGNINQNAATSMNQSNSILNALSDQQKTLVNTQLGYASTAGAGNVGDLYSAQARQGMYNTIVGSAVGALAGKAVGKMG